MVGRIEFTANAVPLEAEASFAQTSNISFYQKAREKFGDVAMWANDKKLQIAAAVVLIPAITAACGGGSSKPANTPEGGVAGVDIGPGRGASPIVVETAVMPSATAVREAPTVAPTEVPTEVPTVAPTATAEAKQTREQVEPAEIGSFEINGKKVTIIEFTERPDASDATRKTVLITCIASADFTGDISGGRWTLSLGTDSGQFPALLLPIHIDFGPEVKDGKLIPGPRLGKIITASIPADINTYSLEIIHGLGTTQDENGGTPSYSIPLRQESLPPDGK